MKPKNPQRVIAQHSSRIRKLKRDLWWAVPVTAVPLVLLVTSFVIGWRWWWKLIIIFFLLNGCLSLYEIRFELVDQRRKRDAVDATVEPEEQH